MALADPRPVDGRVIGRYVVFDSIGTGGMASVHLGRYRARFGFSRTVAIKRLHEQYAREPEFVAMLVDEARLASRVNHPNVVSTLDVVFEEGEVLLVMEYVPGESLATLLRLAADSKVELPAPIVVAILAGALRGLHAAHEAQAEDGTRLGIVHRDMSPQNVMVGTDGIAKVLDFGVAKAALRSQTTSQGQIKGKFSYMAPEQLLNQGVDARTDVFACGIVSWECLTLRRLFSGNDVGEMVGQLLSGPIVPPSQIHPLSPPALDAVVLRALQRKLDDRYRSAAEFADALEAAVKPARTVEVGQWVRQVAGESLEARARLLADIEANRHTTVPSRPPLLEAGTASSTASTVVVISEPARTKWVRSVSLGLLALGLVLVVLALGRSSPRREDASAASLRASEPAHPASTIRELEPVASPTTERSQLPVSASFVSPSAASSTPTPLPARRLPRTKPSTPTKPSCNPPYWIDKSGIRRVRAECL